MQEIHFINPFFPIELLKIIFWLLKSKILNCPYSVLKNQTNFVFANKCFVFIFYWYLWIFKFQSLSRQDRDGRIKIGRFSTSEIGNCSPGGCMIWSPSFSRLFLITWPFRDPVKNLYHFQGREWSKDGEGRFSFQILFTPPVKTGWFSRILMLPWSLSRFYRIVFGDVLVAPFLFRRFFRKK